ncbi:MAG: glycosyltransferase [Acidobacteriota bacterium]
MIAPAAAPPLISIIVPVFNEGTTVAAVVARLLTIDLPAAREIIIVNDGSTDDTRGALDRLAGAPGVTVVHVERNRGKGHAVRLGFARARGTVVAIQDADLELDPAQLAALVAPILDGSSAVVYGSRFLAGRPDAPRLTLVANRVLTAVTNAVYGSSLTDMETCYKIMRGEVARSLELTAERFDIEPEITARLLVAGHRIDERPVTFMPRSRAAGKKIGWRDGVIAIRVLLRLRPRGAFLTRGLLLVATAALLAGCAIAVSGGIDVPLGRSMIRAHNPLPGWALALAAGVLALTRGPARLGAASAWWWKVAGRGAGPLALVLAFAASAVGVTWGTHVAGGSDSYCYLSEAELLAAGHARQIQPVAADPPWPDSRWAFVPAGHAPAPSPPGASVPICPAGYPLMMAAARLLAGRAGMFLVVPLMGALAVWLTFVLGRRVAGPRAGLMAALLFCTSPVFVYQLVQPMNDIPAVALWLLALVLSARSGLGARGSGLGAWSSGLGIRDPGPEMRDAGFEPRTSNLTRASDPGSRVPDPGSLAADPDTRHHRAPWRTPLAAGAATGAALLIRPNLLPLAIVPALWSAAAPGAAARERVRTLAWFAIGAAPFVLAVLAVQNAMYGGPLKSGYGTLGLLFTIDHVWPNLRRYPQWLLETQTPFVVLALAAPWIRAAQADGRSFRAIAPAGWLLAFAAATLACYVPYVVFDAWWYLRFVLPAVAVLLILAAMVFVQIISRLSAAWRAPVFALACGALALVYLKVGVDRQVFRLQALESRFRTAGEYVAAHLPPDAAVVTTHESGSVRFYANRLTLVWAEVDPASLDRALQYLRSRGYRPYLLFETWEEADFRKRFEGRSAIAQLNWPPIADINHEVRIYDPDDYARYRSGTPVYTDRVWKKAR